jgi:hypothetical protein
MLVIVRSKRYRKINCSDVFNYYAKYIFCLNNFEMNRIHPTGRACGFSAQAINRTCTKGLIVSSISTFCKVVACSIAKHKIKIIRIRDNTTELEVHSKRTAGRCRMAELIIYNRRLTHSERRSVENYLGARYGIAVTS